MAKPRLIILIRHGQSEGNKNRAIHQTVPDHRVKLTPEGWSQAHEAGRRLRKLLRPEDTIQFFTSPYRRTRDTTEGILSTLTSDDPEPSPYRRDNIKVYEEPRLREQDFGNFQPCTAEMERMWQERADYGHFFYRIPNGESAADAYDRISGFNESLWRQFGDDDFPSVCILVTHGLMSRVFLMKWYHFTVEYFEDLRNINHCEFLIMRKQDDGKYLLENKLRTWSQLRRERYGHALGRDGKEKDRAKDHVKLAKNKSFVVTRRWGGCPNGCNHSAHYKRRHDLDALREREGGERDGELSHKLLDRTSHNTSDEEDEERSRLASQPARTINKPPPRDAGSPHASSDPGGDDSSPEDRDSLPSLIKNHRLHLGRDFGGTYSGHASVASGSGSGSESESESEHSDQRQHPSHTSHTRPRRRVSIQQPGRSHAERLGDGPGSGDSDSGNLEIDLDKAEEEDRSILGSIY